MTHHRVSVEDLAIFFFFLGGGVMSGPSLAQTKFSRPMAL